MSGESGIGNHEEANGNSGRTQKEDPMSEKVNEGRMQKLKGKVQSTWGSITDDDYQKSEGNREQLIGTIKEKTGQAEDEIRRLLDGFDKDDDER
jgi:uncharacterized protein YjbJ (UPF0337 family)